MSSHQASTRGAKITVGVIVALALVIVFALVRLNGDDEPAAAQSPSPSAVDSEGPSDEPSPSPSPESSEGMKLKPSQEKTIEIPNAPSVDSTLGLDCGGAYPTVYFRTKTKSAEQTICADSPGGSHLAYVSKSTKDGSHTVVKAGYAYLDDSYIAVKGDTTWVIGAGTGNMAVYKDGRLVRTEKSTFTWEIPEPPEDV